MRSLLNDEKWFGKRSGFSVLEMAITLVIFSSIVLVTYKFYTVANNNMNDNELQIQFKQKADRVMDQIFYDLKQAGRPTTRVLQGTVPGVPQLGFYVPTDALYRPGGYSYGIGFQLPAGNYETGSVLDPTTQITYGNKILYYLNSGNQLVRASVTSSALLNAEVVARDVTYFEVQRDRDVSPSYVEVALNLQEQSMSRRMVFSGEDPLVGLKRAGGSRISFRNLPSTEVASSESPGISTSYGTCYPSSTVACGF